MSISILGKPRARRVDRGWRINGYFQFSTTDLTGYLPIDNRCPRIAGGIKLFPQGPTTFGDSDVLQDGTGVTVSASAAFTMIAPRAGVVASAGFVVDTTVSTDDTNYWSIGIINTSNSSAVVVDIAVATNTNKVTGGTAFTADTLRALTVTSTTADKTVSAGDILEWTFTKAASAANLVELTRQIVITPTTGLGIQEQVYADVVSLIATSGATAGYLIPTVSTNVTPNGLAVPITRRGTNPTSGLIVAFEYEGSNSN